MLRRVWHAAAMVLLTCCMVAPVSATKAQQQGSEEEKRYGISFSGFVKSDFFVDTRHTFSPREGHFMLWPLPPKLDVNGVDLHDATSFNFLPIQSQLSGRITGPDAFGARTSGLIEADFFGTTNATTNLLRMRHAFIRLNWSRAELLTGQFWHPLFNTDCFPNTISFNHGAPINPFSRAPMARFGFTAGMATARVAAVSQRDFVSFGPAGGSSDYLRNATMPELYGELFFTIPLDENKSRTLRTGVLMGSHTLVPRQESTVNGKTYQVNEEVQSISARAFATLTTPPITLKVTGIYGENLSNVLGITGFAVVDVVDTITGLQQYAPTASHILWAELHTNGTRWQAGVFAGINRNRGTTKPMQNPDAPVYGLTNQITQVLRVAPRVIFISGATRFALEVEHTITRFAAEGSNRDAHGLPDQTNNVANTRILLAAYYVF